MKRPILEFNSQIRDLFKIYNIPLNEGLGVLIMYYYNIFPSYIPEKLERDILATGIISKNYSTDTIEWKINLFKDTENNFEWITEWMDGFKRINPERKGIKRDVLQRMKKFFVNNPGMTKEKVFQATINYFRTVRDPQYLKKSHKFIYEEGSTSMLQDYVDRLDELNNDSEVI